MATASAPAAAPTTGSQLLLARQPILDRDRKVAAYELLFRGADVADGDAATSQVLLNAFQELDITEVTGGHPAFVNFTRQLVLHPPPFPAGQLVVEVLEDVAADREVLAGLSALREAGFTIALDDFAWRAELEPMLALADIVKLDVLAEGDGLEAAVARLSGRGLRLLAEKVETHEQFEQCLALGCELFQGYFFCKPELVHGRTVPPARQAVLRLVAAIADPGIDFAGLEAIISAEPVLSFRLLKLVNSAAFHTRAEVENLRTALSLLGISQVRSWSMLLALATLDDKPRVLATQAVLRAQMCARVGARISDDAEPFHMAGMLSAFEGFFDTPLPELLEQLPVAPRVRAAVLDHDGPIGQVLAACLAWETGAWNALDWAALGTLGLAPADLSAAYLEALEQAQAAAPLVR